MALSWASMDSIRYRLFGAPRGRDGELRAEQPLRSELLSVDQLRQHARTIASSHEIDKRFGPDRLLPRLAENEVALLRAYEAVSDAVKQGVRIAPAADWLLDNFHLIEEQIRTARRHLPRTYSGELPRLVSGPLAGYRTAPIETAYDAHWNVAVRMLSRCFVANPAWNEETRKFFGTN
jgi:hypothetical protein